MSNPIYGLLNGQQNNLLAQFQQFKQSFNGDPNQTINQMLQSGKVTQEQVNRATQIANQMKGMLHR